MNVFIDVDYTILSVDNALRPGTLETFERLVDDGHAVHVWSGEGLRWRVVREHGLEPFVSGVHHKPLFDFHARLERLGVPTVPDFVVDDYPEIVACFGGLQVRPFTWRAQVDDDMHVVYEIVTELAANGSSSHARWQPPSVARCADG
jgi:hypothetical protein